MSDTVVLWAVTLTAVALTAWRSRPYIVPLLNGRSPAARRTGHPVKRLAGVLAAVGLHRKLLRKPISGVLHAMILSSFLVLLTAILQAFGSGLFPGFSLAPVGGETWIALLQEIFALIMLAGVGLAAWHRHVIRPARFKGSNGRDATMIYLLIVAIVVSMLMEAAFAVRGGAPAGWRPVSSLIARGLPAEAGPATGETVFYWVHIAAILGFLIYIPTSKHRHMFLAAPNIYFRSMAARGTSPATPEGREAPGAATFGDFDWKQKLDLLSCTECGRCQAVCPAHAAGQPLSPKVLITDMRDALADPGRVDGPIVGGVIAPETLWACTTCRACMEACPVEIEHLPKIIDLRRTLVEQGTVSPGLQDAFMNLTNNGNSMGRPPRQRARWTKGLPFKVKDARKEPVDVLWFVGDYASFDPRAQEITRRVAQLFHMAGVDFGILYDGERNSGNDVRRAGEEGLFEMLAQANIDALDATHYNRIVTTDPHSLNALRNEYIHLGAQYDVRHYTTFLVELLDAGRLHLDPALGGGGATYHDPCYLGRYNDEFDAPRRLIREAGLTLHDMPRCRGNSFCCGAGGGRIWQDDAGITERPSENRIREALSLGDVSVFVTSCPKDKVMYSAAVDALGEGERITVRDIAELFEIEARPTADAAHSRG